MQSQGHDQQTADAFADSWNNLPAGSVYTREQVEDWFAPILPKDVVGKTVLELGCGNGSLLVHVSSWKPAQLIGVDLGESVKSAQANMNAYAQCENWEIRKDDLITFRSDGFDIVYSIGVLHHLKHPLEGFRSVLANVTRGGRFHCWVYGHEGNAVVRWLVEPIRRLSCRLPWWVTKYGIATTLSVPFYLYGFLFRIVGNWNIAGELPLAGYMKWISKREFSFYRHVAFDQLVTPQTCYIRKSEIESWLVSDPRIVDSYVIQRNGNSWKFGGRIA